MHFHTPLTAGDVARSQYAVWEPLLHYGIVCVVCLFGFHKGYPPHNQSNHSLFKMGWCWSKREKGMWWTFHALFWMLLVWGFFPLVFGDKYVSWNPETLQDSYCYGLVQWFLIFKGFLFVCLPVGWCWQPVGPRGQTYPLAGLPQPVCSTTGARPSGGKCFPASLVESGRRSGADVTVQTQKGRTHNGDIVCCSGY